jgi:choline dehydrogenase-like flavoprotein
MSFAPMLESDVTSWSGESDVVVVGFGGAGACAAIAAADEGASVMIVEACIGFWWLDRLVLCRNLFGWWHENSESSGLRRQR